MTNPKNAIAWNNLGAVMDATEAVDIDRKAHDKLDCYRAALEHDEKLSNAWYNVACVMYRDERSGEETRPFRVRGQVHNKVSCLLRAVEENPQNGNAWKMILDTMRSENVRSYTARDGKKVTKELCKDMVAKHPSKD